MYSCKTGSKTYSAATRLSTPARSISRPSKTWERELSTPAKREPSAGIVDAVASRLSSALVMS